jgi:hypothetical protein
MLHFLGIGAQKAGTTWLYANLREHKGLFLPDTKELHFWDQQRARGLDWYRAQFAAAAPHQRAGEITPAYAILEPAVIAELHAALPAVRLLYLLRNPIERAWSAALMAIPRAELALEEASDTWFLDHFHSHGSSRRGDYESCLRHWHAAFGREALHVELFDDILAAPRAVLERCCAHIGADPHGLDHWSDEEMRVARNTGLRQPIRPTLKRALHRLYRPRIERLGDYLGRDLSRWLAEAPPAPSLRQRLRETLAGAAHALR